MSLSPFQYKPSSHFKGNLEFERVRLKQDLTGQHLVCLSHVSACCRQINAFSTTWDGS